MTKKTYALFYIQEIAYDLKFESDLTISVPLYNRYDFMLTYDTIIEYYTSWYNNRDDNCIVYILRKFVFQDSNRGWLVSRALGR